MLLLVNYKVHYFVFYTLIMFKIVFTVQRYNTLSILKRQQLLKMITLYLKSCLLKVKLFLNICNVV